MATRFTASELILDAELASSSESVVLRAGMRREPMSQTGIDGFEHRFANANSTATVLVSKPPRGADNSSEFCVCMSWNGLPLLSGTLAGCCGRISFVKVVLRNFGLVSAEGHHSLKFDFQMIVD